MHFVYLLLPLVGRFRNMTSYCLMGCCQEMFKYVENNAMAFHPIYISFPVIAIIKMSNAEHLPCLI